MDMEKIGLPKELAIKIVKGDGKRVIALFADPNCHYCQQFEKNLEDVNNITVYVFPYNILSVDSMHLSHAIWCSPDPAKAWENWMLRKERPDAPSAECTFPNDRILELGAELKVRATPTIYFADGSRVEGAIPAQGMEEKFAAIQSA